MFHVMCPSSTFHTFKLGDWGDTVIFTSVISNQKDIVSWNTVVQTAMCASVHPVTLSALLWSTNGQK